MPQAKNTKGDEIEKHIYYWWYNGRWEIDGF